MEDGLDFASVIERLRSRGVEFDRGLSDGEIDLVERRFGFRFPPDLRAFLQSALPVAVEANRRAFPNWRADDEAMLGGRLDWPVDSVVFDVEHNAYWNDDWGDRPDEMSEAMSVARIRMASLPRVIPVYGHRYLPSEPCIEGNPVFSIYQTDVIVYGWDLAHYFAAEFGFGPECQYGDALPEREIAFWSELTRS